jgi:hypothetical protein
VPQRAAAARAAISLRVSLSSALARAVPPLLAPRRDNAPACSLSDSSVDTHPPLAMLARAGTARLAATRVRVNHACPGRHRLPSRAACSGSARSAGWPRAFRPNSAADPYGKPGVAARHGHASWPWLRPPSPMAMCPVFADTTWRWLELAQDTGIALRHELPPTVTPADGDVDADSARSRSQLTNRTRPAGARDTRPLRSMLVEVGPIPSMLIMVQVVVRTTDHQ